MKRLSFGRLISQRATVLSVAILLSLLVANVAATEERDSDQSGLTGEDLIALYRQNLLSFRTLMVTSSTTEENGPNFFNGIRRAVQRNEAELQDATLSAEKKGQLQQSIVNLKRIMESPSNVQPRVFHQQFFSDRSGFQIRFPNTFGDGASVGENASFPEGRLSDETAKTLFGNTHIVNFSGDRSGAFQIWTGIRHGVGTGIIHVTLPPNSDIRFPPLAMLDLTLGVNFHPFDLFFSKGPDGLKIGKFDIVDGRRLLVVERHSEIMHKQGFISIERFEEYRDRIRGFDIERAWIDLERGALPLRIEFIRRFEFDGKRYDDPWKIGPNRTIDQVEVLHIDGVGYYPVSSVDQAWEIDLSHGEDWTIVEILEGAAVTAPRAWRSRKSFHAESVRANVDLAALFDFQFPDGTVYADQRVSKGLVAGAGGAEKLLRDAAGPATQPVANLRNSHGHRQWLAYVNIILLTVVATALIWRWTRSRN